MSRNVGCVDPTLSCWKARVPGRGVKVQEERFSHHDAFVSRARRRPRPEGSDHSSASRSSRTARDCLQLRYSWSPSPQPGSALRWLRAEGPAGCSIGRVSALTAPGTGSVGTHILELRWRHGSPTPRSAPTRRPRPRSRYSSARLPGSPNAGSPSSGCCPTTVPATARSPGATRVPSSGSRTNAPALPPADQRQVRAILPDPGRRLGLRPLLRLRSRATSSVARLASLLQSPPDPLRDRQHTHQQEQQPAWTSQLENARTHRPDSLRDHIRRTRRRDPSAWDTAKEKMVAPEPAPSVTEVAAGGTDRRQPQTAFLAHDRRPKDCGGFRAKPECGCRCRAIAATARLGPSGERDSCGPHLGHAIHRLL